MAATRVALAGPGSASDFQVGPAEDGLAQFDLAGVRFSARRARHRARRGRDRALRR